MTAARPTTVDSAHWYLPDGTPFYEVMGKTTLRPRSVTVRDATGIAVPSVSNYLRVVAAPQLQSWLIGQAIEAAATTPRAEGESDESWCAKVHQAADEESKRARQLGSDIHDAIALALGGKPFGGELKPFVEPVLAWLQTIGAVKRTEFVVMGEDYGGRVDVEVEMGNGATMLVDFKTTGAKQLPKDGYPEQKMQLAAYAAAAGCHTTANLYISTARPGEIMAVIYDDCAEALEAFKACQKLWRFTLGRNWEPPKAKETRVIYN